MYNLVLPTSRLVVPSFLCHGAEGNSDNIEFIKVVIFIWQFGLYGIQRHFHQYFCYIVISI